MPPEVLPSRRPLRPVPHDADTDPTLASVAADIEGLRADHAAGFARVEERLINIDNGIAEMDARGGRREAREDIAAAAHADSLASRSRLVTKFTDALGSRTGILVILAVLWWAAARLGIALPAMPVMSVAPATEQAVAAAPDLPPSSSGAQEPDALPQEPTPVEDPEGP